MTYLKKLCNANLNDVISIKNKCVQKCQRKQYNENGQRREADNSQRSKPRC